jgi:nanoRNase/pAp phosphatase (c-di-AMP/oligoRNAs hydrolase)
VDVSVIAKKYKGGGHPKASAFKWTGSIEKLFDSTSNKKRK